MTWEKGYREYKRYNTQAESFEDFKRIWSKSYKTFPDIRHALVWTGDDRKISWLKNVKDSYNKLN